MTHPRSVYWMMQGASVDDVAHEYRLIVENPHHDAWLGRADGVPAFLAETYDPAHGELAELPELRPGDLGMHVLVAPDRRAPCTASPAPSSARCSTTASPTRAYAAWSSSPTCATSGSAT